MAGQYTHTTFQSLIDQLAVDLGDSSKVHFLDSELQYVLLETRRLWNLLTAYDRTSISFNTVPGTTWYDLRVQAPAQLGWTVRDVEQITALQYRLYEPISPNIGTGMSEQFSLTELVRTLQQSRDRFLVDTECEITRNAEVVINGGGTGLYELDDTVIRIVRASWRTTAGTRHPLRGPTDVSAVTALVPSWRTSPRSGIPTRWEIASTPNLVLRLDPPPAADGYLELFTINTGPALDPTANANAGTLLSIPDNLTAAVGWSALEHILSKHGIGRDSTRVQFANLMYSIYRETARVLPLILDVQIDGNSIRTTQIDQLDRSRYGWEGRNRDQPKVAAIAGGGSLIALCPVPDDTYSIGVDIVRQTPIVATTDFLPIGREQLSALLAWAKQLALFKVGGAPLSVAQRSSGLLIEQARRYNESRIADSTYLIEMLSQGDRQDQISLPRTPQLPADQSDPRDTASTRSSRGYDASFKQYKTTLGGQ